METERAPRINWLWVVLLMGLGIWIFWMILPSGPPEITIPYSVFLREVRDGNVSQVTIADEQISGTFTRPMPHTLATPGAQADAAEDAGTFGPRTYSNFRTTLPREVGDPSLLPLLEQSGVVVEAQTPSGSWLLALLTWVLPFLLIGFLFMRMSRRAGGGIGQGSSTFDFMRSKARRYSGTVSQVTFDDVAGVDEAKKDLEEVVDFLRYPHKYHSIGARIPLGVLLVGPPGTGKTLMGRAVAGEAGVPFFHISASEFVEMFVGVGASRVRDLFAKAKEAAPSIVFIDELDAVGRRRGTGLGNTNDEREQTLNQLLVEMDGFEERHDVIIMAATNRPDVLDPALLRPGRFDRQVTIGLPDRKGREAILRTHVRNIRLNPEVNLELLARSTTGMSGAELANLANEAALNAARNNRSQVEAMDFEEALDKLQLGEKRSLLLSPRDQRLIAYHEGGHALVAWMLPIADPVHKVTIIPRGRALGVTHQLPDEDQYNYSREYLMARLAVMLGGRVAEEVALNDITTGAENDIQQASALARRMIARWGMGGLGPVSFESESEQPFLGYEMTQGRTYSEDTAARIDRDVQALMAERHAFATKLITREQAKLDALVEAMLEEETVDHEGLVRVLGPRPEPVIPEPGPQTEPAPQLEPAPAAAGASVLAARRADSV